MRDPCDVRAIRRETHNYSCDKTIKLKTQKRIQIKLEKSE